MAVSYAELKYSHNKLAVLLNRLSYPDKTEAEYWLKWSRQPLHEFVLKIIRGLGESGN